MKATYQKNMMKRMLMPLCAVVAMMCGGCSMLEHPNNKELDGYWHLVGVDTLATNGKKDLADDLLFWSIQARLMTVTDRSVIDSRDNYVMHMTITDFKTIHIYDIRQHDKNGGDPEITDVSLLAPFGINQLEETFTVESVSGSKMILKDEILRLYFKRM